MFSAVEYAARKSYDCVTGKDTAGRFNGCCAGGIAAPPAHVTEYDSNLPPQKTFVGKTVGTHNNHVGVPARHVVTGTPVVR